MNLAFQWKIRYGTPSISHDSREYAFRKCTSFENQKSKFIDFLIPDITGCCSYPHRFRKKALITSRISLYLRNLITKKKMNGWADFWLSSGVNITQISPSIIFGALSGIKTFGNGCGVWETMSANDTCLKWGVGLPWGAPTAVILHKRTNPSTTLLLIDHIYHIAFEAC